MRAALLLPTIAVSLRLRGFRATQRWLGPHAGEIVAPSVDADSITAEIQMVSRMVLAAARHSPFTTTCLERSLALWHLLARRGVAVQLRIGVRKTTERFSAHAWVEREGTAIGEAEATHQHYAAFDKEFSEELT